MVKKPSLDYRAYEQKIIHFTLRHHIMISAAVIIGLIGFSIVRVNMLSNPPIDQEYVDDRSAELTRVRFNEEAIERIQKLKDSGVDLEAEFSNRQNPFNE